MVLGGPHPGILDSIEVYWHSAKRGGTADYLVDSANVTGNASCTVTDLSTACTGAIAPSAIANRPVEPGTMRLVIEGDWTNWFNASVDVTITRTDNRPPPVAEDFGIAQGQLHSFSVNIPAGTTTATFELSWGNKGRVYCGPAL